MALLDWPFANAIPATTREVTRNTNAPIERMTVPPTLPWEDIAPLKRKIAISPKNALAMDGQKS
jgi:hypothetical protein